MMLTVGFDCCVGSVVDWDSSEKEEDGGSVGAAHSERTNGLEVMLKFVDVMSAVNSSKM